MVLVYRRHTKRILQNLDRMLDRAINGTFTADTLDETMYSAVENKLSRYLADSELSARNVEQEKELKLLWERSDVEAHFDEKWTTEALLNIVDNAVKYTEKGSVTLRIKEYEMFVCIEVADTGIGIPEEEQAKIFGRFYRSNEVRNKEGVGIGLYLARQIISGEGGYIKVSSKPGEGTVFGVYLAKK